MSEDVDLTHDIRALVAELVPDRPDALSPNRSQERKWTKAVREALREWTHDVAQPALASALQTVEPDGKVEASDTDVFIHYVPLNEGTSYGRPEVKLEFTAGRGGSRMRRCRLAAMRRTMCRPSSSRRRHHAFCRRSGRSGRRRRPCRCSAHGGGRVLTGNCDVPRLLGEAAFSDAARTGMASGDHFGFATSVSGDGPSAGWRSAAQRQSTCAATVPVKSDAARKQPAVVEPSPDTTLSVDGNLRTSVVPRPPRLPARPKLPRRARVRATVEIEAEFPESGIGRRSPGC